MYLTNEPESCVRVVTSVPVYVASEIIIAEDRWVSVKARWPSKRIKPRSGEEWEDKKPEELLLDNQEGNNKRGYNNRFRVLPGLLQWKDSQGDVLIKN